MEHDRHRGLAVDPRSGAQTLAVYAEGWLATRRVRGRPLAPKTAELYAILLRVHVLPTFGNHQLNRITTEAVRRWHAQVSADSSPMQAAKSYRLLRAILATATSDGRLAVNPCRISGAGQERSAERPALTVEAVLVLAETIAPRFRAMVFLAGFGGLRLGEILAVRRRHVDLGKAVIVVESQVVNLHGGRRMVTEPKTDAGRRSVALPQVAVEALESHLSTYVDTAEDSLLFTGEDGGPLPATTFYRAWRIARHARRPRRPAPSRPPTRRRHAGGMDRSDPA